MNYEHVNKQKDKQINIHVATQLKRFTIVTWEREETADAT
jgi:hypothetical protein